MKRFILITMLLLLLTGCGSKNILQETTAAAIPETTAATEPVPEATMPKETLPPDPVEELMRSMTLEEWVGQLFLVGADPQNMEQHIENYNLGGLLLFASDFANETPGDSAVKKIARWQEAAKIPLLIAVDEEGGTVTRVSCHPYYRGTRFLSPRKLYYQGGLEQVLKIEQEKCLLLSSLGVNVNLAPVVDVTTDSSAFMYQRSLGEDAATTGEFAAGMVKVMNEHGIGNALKHFPGYGNNVDTHTGIAVDSRSLEEFQSKDLIPFQAGIDAGCGAVLVSHTIVEAFDPELPASLSPAVHRYLREEMGFEGVIMTDDLIMQAITDLYGAGEAAVMAVLAGNDLLCCTTFEEQYEAVLAAVMEGRIPFDTLKAAVRNVLEWKLQRSDSCKKP